MTRDKIIQIKATENEKERIIKASQIIGLSFSVFSRFASLKIADSILKEENKL